MFWYDGETAAEIVALKGSHNISSLLFAFEEGIQNKEKQQGTITKEEQTVLAVMALQREVNNGGHWQFLQLVAAVRIHHRRMPVAHPMP